MTPKIFLTFFLFQSIYINAQWQRVGFDERYINDIALMTNQIIIPLSDAPYGQVNFYGSANYGGSWDSIGHLNAAWIEEIEVLDNFLFSSLFWACAGFCNPAPCLFRSKGDFYDWDTIYVKEYGVSNLLIHRNQIFVNLGHSFIKSTDCGDIWQTLDAIPAIDGRLHSVDSSLFLITQTDSIFLSNDGGISWQLFNNDLPDRSICVIKNNSHLIFGGIYGIARFKNDVEWELSNTGISKNFRIEILAAKDNIIFASGMDTSYNHLIFCSTNGGEIWFNISEGLDLETFDWINSILIQDHHLFMAAKGIWRYDFSSLVGVNDKTVLALNFYLSQNYPNPFNPSTKIRYAIPLLGGAGGGFVLLKVYDVLGNEVATLVNEYKPAGSYEVEFSTRNGMASGVYYYQLYVNNYTETKKMLYLK